MKRSLTCVGLVLAIAAADVGILQAQDRPDCCALIFSTGRFLGWGSALLEATRSRQAPSPYDQIILQQIQGASVNVANAYQACAAYIPAWQSWPVKQDFLAAQIAALRDPVNHVAKRVQAFGAVSNTYAGWGNELSIMMLNGQVIHHETCATGYFRLGFDTAYASQAYRQAQEAVGYGDLDRARAQMSLAAQRLAMAEATLGHLRALQEPLGEFRVSCSDFAPLGLEARIQNLRRNSYDTNQLFFLSMEADNLSDGILLALQNDCPRTRGSGPGVRPPVGPPPDGGGGGGGGGRADECRDRYCPICATAITLLGQSTSRECQDCLARNRALIEQCRHGGEQQGTGAVGHWNWFTGNPVCFRPDGVVRSRSGNAGRWWMEGSVVHVQWTKGSYHDVLRFENNGARLQGRNQHGANVWGTLLDHKTTCSF